MKISKEQIESARKILAKYEAENGFVTISYTSQVATNCDNCTSCCEHDCTFSCSGSCSVSCSGSAS